jgi:hypothetical protein
VWFKVITISSGVLGGGAISVLRNRITKGGRGREFFSA